jgi:hypothetical protein
MNNLFNLKNRLFHSYLVNKIFTKVNIYKFLIIFTVGVISRALVNYFSGVNVFIDFLHYISLFYYITFSMFIVLVHDFINYFYMDINPSTNFQSKVMEPQTSTSLSNGTNNKYFNSYTDNYKPENNTGK